MHVENAASTMRALLSLTVIVIVICMYIRTWVDAKTVALMSAFCAQAKWL